jgi:hypothetical protein
MGVRARHCEGYDRLVSAIVEESTHTGDVNETTVGTLVVPADSMGPYGLVRITSAWETAVLTKINIYFGQINAANRVGYWQLPLNVFLEARPIHIWNTNATNAQDASAATDSLALSVHYDAGVTPVSMTEDTTSDVTVYFRVQNNAGGDTSGLNMALMEIFRFDA